LGVNGFNKSRIRSNHQLERSLLEVKQFLSSTQQVQRRVQENAGRGAKCDRGRESKVLERFRRGVFSNGVSPFAAEAKQDGVPPGNSNFD
jgi:hypothetical protein